jgi:hypothetical protein
MTVITWCFVILWVISCIFGFVLFELLQIANQKILMLEIKNNAPRVKTYDDGTIIWLQYHDGKTYCLKKDDAAK